MKSEGLLILSKSIFRKSQIKKMAPEGLPKENKITFRKYREPKVQERLGVLVAARSMHSIIPLTAPAIRRRHTQKGIGPLLRILVFPHLQRRGSSPSGHMRS